MRKSRKLQPIFSDVKYVGVDVDIVNSMRSHGQYFFKLFLCLPEV